MTLTDVLDLVSRIGFGGMLVTILFGNYKGIWRWGKDFEEMRDDRDYWREAALSGTHTADIVTEYAVRQRASRDAASARAVRRRSIAEEATHPPPARTRRPPR